MRSIIFGERINPNGLLIEHPGKPGCPVLQGFPLADRVNKHFCRNGQAFRFPAGSASFKCSFRGFHHRNDIQIAPNAPIAAGIRTEVTQSEQFRMPLQLICRPFPQRRLNGWAIRPFDHGRIGGSLGHIGSHPGSAAVHSVRKALPPDVRWHIGWECKIRPKLWLFQ